MTRKVTAGHMALRQSEHGSHETTTPPWELAAMDFSGEEMYRTEYQDSKQEAVDAAAALNSSDPSTPDLPEGVARFKPVRTE